MVKKIIIFLLVCIALLNINVVSADQTTLDVTKDSYVDTANPYSNYGGANSILVRGNSPNHIAGLLGFSVPDDLIGVNITSATLYICVNNNPDIDPGDPDLWDSFGDIYFQSPGYNFTEGGVTYDNFGGYSEGSGAGYYHLSSLQIENTGWKLLDCTGFLQSVTNNGMGIFSIYIEPGFSSGTVIDFDSKEGANSPYIVVNHSTPTISIDCKITQSGTPLTSVSINDENNTGGFPNENGYRYLTPYRKDSKEYTIYLLGEDLQPGFKLDISASSADVTKLTVDIEDLDSSKTYDVLFDYEQIDSIYGVSEVQYDITSFSLHTIELIPVAGVNIYGTVFNATSNESLSGANVSLLQDGTYYNTTTDANGAYSITNLSTNLPINVTATKIGYTHNDFSVTAEGTGNFKMDLYMLPPVVGVHGLVVDYPWHQAINGSTVWLWNATYNTSTTTDNTGYYLITGIANGDYTMNASASGYPTSDNVTITVTDNMSVQQFTLSQTHNLTVTAVNSQSQVSIQSFSATIDTETINTTDGSAVFSLGYGLYYVGVTAEGYYPNFGYAFLDENQTLEIKLTPTSVYFAPHNVKFTVKSLFGTRYDGVTVNVYEGATATQYNLRFSNATGTDGAVVFRLSEDVQYTITFIDATQGINKEITLYPKNDDYTVYIFTTSYVPDDTPLQTIQYGITSASINLTAGNINASFNDSSATFTHANFTIRSEDGTTLYAFTATDTAKDWSQTVTYNSSTKYTATIEVFNTALTDGKVMKTAVINFNYGVRPEFDFGWSEQWQYQLLGACLMLFIGGLFSAGNAHLGAVIVIGIGWFNLYAGWFPRSITAGLMMLLGTLLAVAFVMRKQENKI